MQANCQPNDELAHTAGSGYESVASSVVRSGLWSASGQVASLLVSLLATPFTIRLLGAPRYGVLALLQSVQNWIGLADFGMTTASTRYAGASYAAEDSAAESTVTWTALAITVGATVVLTVAMAIVAPFVVRSILHVHAGLVGPTEIALRLAAATCVATVIAGTLNTPLIVRLKWRDLTLISTGSAIAGTVLVPLTLEILGGGVVTSTIVSLAISTLAAGALLWMAIKLQPAMRRPTLSQFAARKLLRYGAALTVAGVAQIPLYTADRFLLAHYRSTTTVAYYVVAWRLATLLTIVPMAICQPLFPGLIKLRESGDARAAKALYRQALQGLFLVLTPSMLLLAFIARPFLALWAGKAFGAHSTDLFYIMVIGVWFAAAGWLPAYFLSLDHTREFAVLHVLEIVPYVVVTAILTSSFGAAGTASAWAGRSAIDAVILFLLARRFGGVTTSPLSANMIRSAAAPLVLTGVLLLLSPVAVSLVARVACAGLLAGLYAACIWRLVLNQRERDGLVGLSPMRRSPLSRAA